MMMTMAAEQHRQQELQGIMPTVVTYSVAPSVLQVRLQLLGK